MTLMEYIMNIIEELKNNKRIHCHYNNKDYRISLDLDGAVSVYIEVKYQGGYAFLDNLDRVPTLSELHGHLERLNRHPIFTKHVTPILST